MNLNHLSAAKLVLITDTHLAPRAQAFAQNWHAVRKWIATSQADLLIHLGDISADGEHDPSELEAAAAEFSGLHLPSYFLPGNHDIGDRPSASILADYRRCFGSDRWSLDIAGWQLIGLNAQLLGTDSDEEEEQFAWLQTQLASREAPLGMLLHKPLRVSSQSPDDESESGGRYVPATAAQRLRKMSAARILRFVICGHVHQSHQVVDGPTQYIWLASTSFCIPDAVQPRVGEKQVGAMLLQLDATQYSLQPLTPPGMFRHNLLDFPQVYPQLQGMRELLGPAANL